MAKKNQNQPKWDETIKTFIGRAMEETAEQSLAILGRRLRQADTTKARETRWGEKLRGIILTIMQANNLDEKRVSRRNFLRIDISFSIPDDIKGQTIYEELVLRYGRGFTKRLIKKEKVVIPRKVTTAYTVDEAVLAELDPEIKREIAAVIGNKPKVICVDTPKRVKAGKPRRKRRG